MKERGHLKVGQKVFMNQVQLKQDQKHLLQDHEPKQKNRFKSKNNYR